MNAYNGVAKKLTKEISPPANCKFYIYANQQTLEDLCARNPAIKDYCIHPSQKEQEAFEQDLQPWSEKGIKLWFSLLKNGNVVNKYFNIFSKLHHKYKFDLIIHWGENSTISAFCKEKKIMRLAMELGCSRVPYFDSFIIDPIGTNGNASIAKLKISEIKHIVNNKRKSAENCLLDNSSDETVNGYDQQFSPIPTRISQLLMSISKKIAFFPLQLWDDANMLLFSKYDSIQSVIEDIIPKLSNAGYLTIIKPHPFSSQRPDGALKTLMAKNILTHYQNSVIWLDENNLSNARLYQFSDVVITVNSSSGFEATLYDKTVIVLGEAIYKPEGLFPTLEDYLMDNFDRDLYLENLGYLREFFFNAYLQPASAMSFNENFFSYILKLASLSKVEPKLSQKVAYHFYNSLRETRQKLLTHPSHKEKEEKNSEVILETLQMASGFNETDKIINWLNSIWPKKKRRLNLLKKYRLINFQNYLSINPDVKRAKVCPIKHFVNHGEKERRRIDHSLDLRKYAMEHKLMPDEYAFLNYLKRNLYYKTKNL